MFFIEGKFDSVLIVIVKCRDPQTQMTKFTETNIPIGVFGQIIFFQDFSCVSPLHFYSCPLHFFGIPFPFNIEKNHSILELNAIGSKGGWKSGMRVENTTCNSLQDAAWESRILLLFFAGSKLFVWKKIVQTEELCQWLQLLKNMFRDGFDDAGKELKWVHPQPWYPTLSFLGSPPRMSHMSSLRCCTAEILRL